MLIPVWAGRYGGANRTQGDPVGIGSHDVGLASGLGGGNSDAFQAGLYPYRGENHGPGKDV